MVHGREFCTLTTLKRNNFNILHVHILCCTQLILSSIIHSFIQTFKTWLMTTTNSSHGSYSRTTRLSSYQFKLSLKETVTHCHCRWHCHCHCRWHCRCTVTVADTVTVATLPLTLSLSLHCQCRWHCHCHCVAASFLFTAPLTRVQTHKLPLKILWKHGLLNIRNHRSNVKVIMSCEQNALY